ncbi:hypothetical protein [Sinorhizobium meliloti]|uniref:hypothetical protein n=1 Tax=Rhizobium meliloti TaxID=382 RepID=UPI000FD9F51B|nr:hypothetical protein [Sinorhizobium meliloti]RVK92334.1 hypothetical protein CN152_25015 [Sinorhizobium meliloti]RVN44877.1 hypothetical protein CN113_19860 [Sinorhizobium meliloti]
MTTRRDVLVTGLAGLSLLAIPHPPAAATSKITLQVAYAPANFSTMYEGLFKAFMDENPDIAVTARSFATYSDLMQDNLARITGDLPNVSHEEA